MNRIQKARTESLERARKHHKEMNEIVDRCLKDGTYLEDFHGDQAMAEEFARGGREMASRSLRQAEREYLAAFKDGTPLPPNIEAIGELLVG
jgi:hypothetical protein